ncbi:DUF5305 domain-containing protein [Halapricum desulfuricans]|nr:DUF5305 domain-containing protein [Halapricum desulfuricans]
MGSRGLRVRAAVDRYLGVVVLALAVLVVVGGGVAYDAHTGPDERTETTTEQVVTWNATGQFAHEATVVEDTRVFDAGETLTNRTQYFQRIAPTLEGTFTYDYAASNGSLTANASTALVVRSVTDDGTEQWRVTEPLDRTERTLAPGETLRMGFEQNVTAVETTVEEIRSELGATVGTTETFFETTVALDGRRNGEPVETTRSYRLPFTIEDGVYRVNDSGPDVQSGERTVLTERTVPVTTGPLRSYGGPLLAIVGLGGLLGVAVSHRRGWLDVGDRERAYLDYRSDRREFDEWITAVDTPPARLADADDRIETATLGGLVDLAIDTDRRVLETPADRYLVVADGTVYSYDPPSLPRGDDPLAASGGAGGRGDVETQTDDAIEAGETGDHAETADDPDEDES